MSPVEILAIMAMACGTIMGIAVLVLRTRRVGPVDTNELVEEVSKLRAEIAAAKLIADEVRRRPSTFMDMADALNRIRHPIAYDEAVIQLRVLDLAFGNRVRVKLLNGKDVVFTVPPKTGNGAIFRFKGGGKDGRDLHLTVQASVYADAKDGGN